MKLTINQNEHIQETEVIINCASFDKRISNLTDYIRQYSHSLKGTIDDFSYYVPLDSILYIDSVDRKTFFYDKHRIFRSASTLAELEDKLENTLFTRISKSCIVNIAFVLSNSTYENHKLEVVLINGEHLVAGRTYIKRLLQRLDAYSAEIFSVTASLQAAEQHAALKPSCSVYNDGKVVSFPACPSRIIAISYGLAELLCALGQADRIVAVVAPKEEIRYLLPQYQEALQNVPVIRCGELDLPTCADLQMFAPDFIISSCYYPRYLQRNGQDLGGACLYIMEGTVSGHTTMEYVYRDILNLGKIFCVENRAIELVRQIRTQMGLLTQNLADKKTHPVRVFVYDSRENTPITAKGNTLENNLISMAGGENVFGEGGKTYGPVTWAQVAEADPEVIVIHDYTDCMSAQEKMDCLRQREELKGVSAIKSERIVTVHLAEIFPGIQNASFVRKLMQTLHPAVL